MKDIPDVAAQQDADVLDGLFVELALPEQPDWERIERSIWKEWSKSGSASMDLLLDRGRDAMEQGDMNTAIAHLSALIDHAPEFAEGWNARATAFFHAQQFSLSIFDIQQALALNPRHFGALQGLGQILEQLEDEKNALAAYRAAYSLHPNRPDLKDAIDRLDAKLAGTKL